MKGENPLIRRIPIKDSSGKVIGTKEVASYRGLLNQVHKEGLREIRTTLVQAPSKENAETAIVHALVRTNKGSFTGIGDARPGNVNPKIVPHLIRMAETRAEARAMRKAVNIGVVAIEELGDDVNDDVTYEGTMQPANGNGDAQRAPAVAHESASPPAGAPGRRFDGRASDEQRRYLFRLLAQRGIEGDRARAFVHDELGVSSLREAARADVSALIDKVKRGDGIGDGNGTAPGEAA